MFDINVLSFLGEFWPKSFSLHPVIARFFSPDTEVLESQNYQISENIKGEELQDAEIETLF